jgi:plasmid stability protein
MGRVIMANLSLKNINDETHLALKHMAADERTSVSALIVEAIELLFAMRSGRSAVEAAWFGRRNENSKTVLLVR